MYQDVPFHLVHIDLSSKPAWYRSINPRGLVPAVADSDGTIHVESLDICRWLADTDLSSSSGNNSSSPSLAPSDAAGKARMNKIISAGSALSEAGLSFLSGRSGRYWGIGTGQAASQRAEFESALKKAIVDPIKENKGPFLMGTQLTIADIAVFPFVKRYQVACKEFCNGYNVSSVLDGVVGQWLEAMGQRPACQITTACDELLLQAYKKHLSLDFFDYDSYEVTELHPQNEVYRK
jgi:glutathione S-transferase